MSVHRWPVGGGLPDCALIQARYLPDGWRVLVCCVLLNLTRRAQMEKLLDGLFERYPDASAMAVASQVDLASMLRPLGLYNRRAQTLIKLSSWWLTNDHDDVSKCPGVGKYARDAYALLVQRRWREVEPDDHALNDFMAEIREHVNASG